MSSRKRRKAREWMAKEHTARRDAWCAGHFQGAQDERERLTKYVYVKKRAPWDREDLCIGQQPEQPYVRLYIPQDYGRPFSEADKNSPYTVPADIVTFKAIRKCWSDGKGNTVHWWDWEPVR